MPDTEGHSMAVVHRQSSSRSEEASKGRTHPVLLWPFKWAHQPMWYKPGWPWSSLNIEWQTDRVCRPCSEGNGNPLCSDRKSDASDCILSGVLHLIHVQLSSCEHWKWSQASVDDITEATHSSDPTFPGHDDEAAKVWLHCTVWMWKKRASGWHVVASLPAISRQRRRWRWVCEHGALFANI